MQILYLISFAVVLKVASCAWNDDGPTEYTPTFLIEPSHANVRKNIESIVEKNSPRFSLIRATTSRLASTLISLAEEGSISTVEKFLELLSKKEASIPTGLISLVIIGTNIVATAKLLQTSIIKDSHVKYDAIRRNNVKDLLDYLYTQTDVLDGDCIVPWLRRISSSGLPQSRAWFEYLATRANHEALRAAYEEFGTSKRLDMSVFLLGTMTKIERKITPLLELFTQDSNTLPPVIIKIIGAYITADE